MRKHITAHIALSHAIVAAGWATTRLVTRDRPWWLHFVNDFTPLLLAPAAPLGAAAMLAGSGRGVLAAAIPAGLFLGLYGRRFLPRATAVSDVPGLKLMTLNVLCRPRSIEGLVRDILEQDADIVLLQEVLPAIGDLLGPALTEAYPHQEIHPATSARGGAVLSRIPFSSTDLFQLSDRGWYFQDIRFSWAGHSIALFNVHLLRPQLKLSPQPDWEPFDARDRAREVQALLERVQVDGHDVVMAGDFNLTDQTADYRAIRRTFKDAFLEAGQGFGFTYPARSPHARAWYERNVPAFLRLDHVFYSGHLQARSAKVGPSGESDHFSVVVELQRPG